jgi:aspartyl-tRNA(Asn)/glutamyl-tRNA(Gln) amidotransferase subunit C
VEPLAHAAESTDVFREDAPGTPLPSEDALKNAPERTGDFFIVPKIIE